MLSISNTTKAKLPSLAFSDMADAILGKKYELSVAIVPAGKMRQLSRTYRNIDKSTDILSFPLSENEGEIFICLSYTKKEAPNFDRTYENFLAYLFIHGCVHLKGFDHGSTMEGIERRFQKKFGV